MLGSKNVGVVGSPNSSSSIGIGFFSATSVSTLNDLTHAILKEYTKSRVRKRYVAENGTASIS